MKDRIITLPKPIKTIKRKNLSDYTKPEIDRFQRLCNFTEDENQYFTLRSKGKSNVSITLSMCISESKLHEIRRKVESKIDRVLMTV